MPVKSHKKIEYTFVGNNTKQDNKHLLIVMLLLYIISWTKSCFDWLLCFTPDRRREKFFVIVAGRDGPFQPVHILCQTSNCTLVQSFKMNCLFSPPSSLPWFLLPPISIREWKGTFGRKFHVYFTKTLSFITEKAAVNTILTYNKPAEDHSLIPMGWM